MRLPNAIEARVEQKKITDYLLSITSLRGRSKAEFFLGFGFSTDNWKELAEALQAQGAVHEVVRTIETTYGSRIHVDGIIETPDGRNPQIRTVWQFDVGTNYPRLITARPLNSPRSRNAN